MQYLAVLIVITTCAAFSKAAGEEAIASSGDACIQVIACGVKREYRNFPNKCDLQTSGCKLGFHYYDDGNCMEAIEKNKGSTSPLTKETALDSKGNCKVLGSFKDDCNTCNCRVIGSPAGCTRIACPPRPLTKETALDGNGNCKALGGFRNDCNNCNCETLGQAPTCTLKACIPPLTKEDALDSNGKCKVQGGFKNDCNTCNCDTIGQPPACTKKGCIVPGAGPVCSTRTPCIGSWEPVCGVKEEYKTFGTPCAATRAGYEVVKTGQGCDSAV